MMPVRTETASQPISFALGALMLLTTTTTNAAEEQSDWQFGLKIYGWLPSISGDIRFETPGSGEAIQVDSSKIIDALQIAFMGSFEARKGPWSGFTDLLYFDLAGDKTRAVAAPGGSTSLLLDADLEMSGGAWTLGGAYNVWTDRGSSLDLLAGARLLTLTVDLDVSGTGPLRRGLGLSESVDLWDVIVGAKGRYALNEHWFLPYYLDIGTGDTDLTWQAAGGVGYEFDWGEVTLMYRHLEYDQGSDEPLQNLALSGGMLGVGFRF